MISLTALSLVQHLMNEGHGNRSFADGRGYALEISTADVADREDARQARFEEVGQPDERPPRGDEIVVRQVGTGLDEAVVIERDAAVEPFRRRHGPGHHDGMA